MEVVASSPLGDRQPRGSQAAEIDRAELERFGWAARRRYRRDDPGPGWPSGSVSELAAFPQATAQSTSFAGFVLRFCSTSPLGRSKTLDQKFP